ncbi:MAG: hypothetical protein P8L66_00790 [Rhodospirillaceae bacterium]|nr:hypothetical protein [Rhodospirillaceae bacterium]
MTEQERYQQDWTSYGYVPIVSAAVAWRYTDFHSMLDVITDIVRAEAEMWMKPRAGMEEVQVLRDKYRD